MGRDEFSMGKRCEECGGEVPNRYLVMTCQGCREAARRSLDELDEGGELFERRELRRRPRVGDQEDLF
jgi:hypothetical protein